MTFLSCLSIRSKVAGAFGLMLLLVIGVGLTAINRLSAVNDRAADIRDNWLPSTRVQGYIERVPGPARE